MHEISKSVNKVDAADKISGKAKFVSDMYFDDMLYAKTYRSSKSRARIKNIFIPDLPEGYYIIDKNDIPGKNKIKFIFDDFPFFADEYVNYIGEPILLVVGEKMEIIKKIFSKIKVDYEEITPILTIEDAQNKISKPIYGDDNIFASYSFEKGDINNIFERKDIKIIEDVYETGYQEQLYLEPQGVIADYDYINDKINIYGSLQCPYYVKNALMQAFDYPENKIRVVQTTTGGAFGGKEDYPSLIAGHAAFASFKAKRPVKLIFERTEDISFTTKRHPSKIKIKTATDNKNRILAAEIDVKLDGGAYAGLSSVVLQRAMFASTGVYNIPNLKVTGEVYSTNTIPNGAFRGFGSPQAFFAIESHMNNSALKLNVEPIDFKRINMVKTGDPTSTGGTFRDEVFLAKMIQKADEMSDYTKKYRDYASKNCNKGIGMSLIFHGCGFTGSGERDIIKAEVKLKKNENNTVEILIANVDMGQGVHTTFKKIVSNVLNIPLEQVIINNPDTDLVPDSGPTVASRTIMIVGGLVSKAAEDLKVKWKDNEETVITKNYIQPDYIEWDQDKMKGDAYPTYSWSVQVVEIEIHPATYEIETKRVWSVYDVGTVIDENIVLGQCDGGFAQGLGYGIMENMTLKEGNILQNSVTDYVIPSSKDIPKMETIFIDNPYKEGPFGAKGAGELPLVGGAPAYAAAVQNALKIKINKVPLIPEVIMEVLENENKYNN